MRYKIIIVVVLLFAILGFAIAIKSNTQTNTIEKYYKTDKDTKAAIEVNGPRDPGAVPTTMQLFGTEPLFNDGIDSYEMDNILSFLTDTNKIQYQSKYTAGYIVDGSVTYDTTTFTHKAKIRLGDESSTVYVNLIVITPADGSMTTTLNDDKGNKINTQRLGGDTEENLNL